MSLVSGFLGTANADTNDYVGEWQQYVLRRNAKGFNTGSTLFGLMSRLKAENADAVAYNWWEKDPTQLNFISAADYNSAATVIVLTQPDASSAWQYFLAAQILENSVTGERIRVVTTPTDQNVTVQRGVQGTAAAAITTGDLFTLITSAQAEGALPVRSLYVQPTNEQNFIQTFDETFSINNAYKAGILRTDLEGPKREAMLDALEKIANRIEFAYLFGVRESAALSAGQTYYTGGVKDGIDRAGLTDNALDGGGVAGVTLQAFQNWLQTFMTEGSDVKLAFCGPKAYAAISNYANTGAAGFRIMNQETVFGMGITSIVTQYGELSLAFHPLMKNATAKQGTMVVVDLALIWQKSMEPLFLEDNIQTPGQDAYVGQFRAKLGIKQKFPEAFGYADDLQLITAT